MDFLAAQVIEILMINNLFRNLIKYKKTREMKASWFVWYSNLVFCFLYLKKKPAHVLMTPFICQMVQAGVSCFP